LGGDELEHIGRAVKLAEPIAPLLAGPFAAMMDCDTIIGEG